MLDSSISSWCILVASFEFCNEFGFESVESFWRELTSLNHQGEKAGRVARPNGERVVYSEGMI
jgi:hypothetical protein